MIPNVSSPTRWLAALAVAAIGAALPLSAAPDPTTQTATFLGGYLEPGQPVGTIDGTTEWYDTASGTWKPAFLAGWHPWGFAPGTNTWINCGPTIGDCLMQTITYRVRFALPNEFTDAHMTLYINADNAGTFFLNGTQVGNRHVGGGNFFLTIDADAALLQPGINELLISVEDWGGAAGFNYRADFSITSELPITEIPPGDQPDTDGDVVPDSVDAFPNDPSEWADTDHDGVGDNSDLAPTDPTIGAQPPDADGDGVADSQDAFPNDPLETKDSDGDGVGDNRDAFPNSNLSPSTMAGTCNSGVRNRLLPTGATFNDLIAQAKAGAANHGAWVNSVSSLSNGWKSAGLITGQDHGKIVSCVATQNGGRK